MAKVLVMYASATGNTEKMAKLVAEGAESGGADVTLKSVDDVDASELLDYDATIVGSPTYYGAPAAPIRKLFDESVKYHGQLEGKVGAAFSSSANIGGGNETTILSILGSMLIHGMVVRGNSKGDHYGPVSINAPDHRVEKQCRELGRRTAELADKMS
ncbi:MAG: flavodoxin domain-containing protein, partial [Planctomycetota bacterium]